MREGAEGGAIPPPYRCRGGDQPSHAKDGPQVLNFSGGSVCVPLLNISTKLSWVVCPILNTSISDLYHINAKWGIFRALYIVGE